MFDKSQLMRGTLEGCILQVISTEVTYGYEIMDKLKSYGFKDISEGTIYPLLIRLEKQELIISEFRSSPMGPKRKYYSITESGIATLLSFKEYWNELTTTIHKIFVQG